MGLTAFASNLVGHDRFLAGYMLLGLLESLGFRAVKDALPDNPKAQERIIGASLFAMAVADVS